MRPPTRSCRAKSRCVGPAPRDFARDERIWGSSESGLNPDHDRPHRHRRRHPAASGNGGRPAMDFGDGARAADADGGMGRQPRQGQRHAWPWPWHRAADRRPDAMDERRRRGVVEGPRVVEPDDRPGDQGERGEGPPLRQPRVEREPDLRHDAAKLPCDQRQIARHGRGNRRHRRRGAEPPALRHPRASSTP